MRSSWRAFWRPLRPPQMRMRRGVFAPGFSLAVPPRLTAGWHTRPCEAHSSKGPPNFGTSRATADHPQLGEFSESRMHPNDGWTNFCLAAWKYSKSSGGRCCPVVERSQGHWLGPHVARWRSSCASTRCCPKPPGARPPHPLPLAPRELGELAPCSTLSRCRRSCTRESCEGSPASRRRVTSPALSHPAPVQGALAAESLGPRSSHWHVHGVSQRAALPRTRSSNLGGSQNRGEGEEAKLHGGRPQLP